MACLEEIAFRKGWLSREQVAAEAKLLSKTLYGQYLSQLIVEK
ncbi:Glucose-1-phosphate thymidylyltransferase 2 [Serratia entomophila]|nr:Glucose-1-phosphate thymidylyltransferase 2 [Serratia entomophila]